MINPLDKYINFIYNYKYKDINYKYKDISAIYSKANLEKKIKISIKMKLASQINFSKKVKYNNFNKHCHQ